MENLDCFDRQFNRCDGNIQWIGKRVKLLCWMCIEKNITYIFEVPYFILTLLFVVNLSYLKDSRSLRYILDISLGCMYWLILTLLPMLYHIPKRLCNRNHKSWENQHIQIIFQYSRLFWELVKNCWTNSIYTKNKALMFKEQL